MQKVNENQNPSGVAIESPLTALERGEDDYVYIAIKPCGDASAILVDRLSTARETAKTVGQWLREGYKVERVLREAGLKRLKRCEHGLIKEQLKRQRTSEHMRPIKSR